MALVNQWVKLRFLFVAVMLSTAVVGGSLEGRVINSVTGEGVGGAKVRVLDRQQYVYYAETDSTGSYRLTGLKDGDYTGEFSKDGFLDNREFVPTHVGGDVAARMDARMEPFGSLRGRVVDEDGKPAAGVRVECGCTGDDEPVTDENGEFAFKDLRPGSYTLVAKPEAKIRMEDGVRLGTVAMYYPSVTELARATPIAVRNGQSVSGIEIRLKSVPVHRVAGVVLDPAGKPVAHATVKLMGNASTALQFAAMTASIGYNATQTRTTTIGPGREPEVARVESREEGAFEFAAVESGDWRLSAEIEVGDDMALAGVVSAPVSEKDLEDVLIRLAAPFAVAVDVDWGNAKPPTMNVYGSGSSLRLMPEEAQPRLFLEPGKNIGGVNGMFPGRYRVLPPYMGLDVYAAAVMWGGRDVNGQIVDLTPGSGPFQIVYKTGLGKVRGVVENGEGCLVMLVPREPAEVSTVRMAGCGTGFPRVRKRRPSSFGSSRHFSKYEYQNSIVDMCVDRGAGFGR
ncbi:MAG TPA: carboxypeptidase-like regulatory domain-containing protein [Bryobacteraceae bacterium]|jgi:hypothetical protein